MRKRDIFVLTLALGVMIMVGCSDSNGGSGGEVPQSSAAYAGSEMPAVLDTTSSTQGLGEDFLWDINDLAGQFAGGVRIFATGGTSSETSDYVEGGDGGSLTYKGSYSSTWSETIGSESVMQSLVFDDFADSAGVDIYYSEGSGGIDRRNAVEFQADIRGIYYDGLQAGRGSLYRSSDWEITTDGDPEMVPSAVPTAVTLADSGPVGTILTDLAAYYSNYDSYFTSQGYDYEWEASQRQMLQTGFHSSNMNGWYNTTWETTGFDDNLSADYAVDYFNSYSNDSPYQSSYRYTKALRDFSQNHSWNFSTATLTSSGNYCAEGDAESYVIGCVDFEINLTWNNDVSGDYNYCRWNSNKLQCYGQPLTGYMTLQADGASASFAYTPTGIAFTFDAGDGSAVFETVLPPIGSD